MKLYKVRQRAMKMLYRAEIGCASAWQACKEHKCAPHCFYCKQAGAK